MSSSRSPAPAVLDDDDLLAEILLRLPPLPSSLPRASAVCKRWRSLASDPAFGRRFRRHHRRNPPLLGCFIRHRREIRFQPTQERPNRLPEDRFPFPVDDGDRNFRLLGCRHGFLLMLRTSKDQGTIELLVWDPFNGQEQPIAIPPRFSDKTLIKHGAVLPAAHGDIQNFQVVLVSIDVQQRVIACVYSSETGVWGNLITTQLTPDVCDIYPAEIAHSIPAMLVEGALYMLLVGISSSIIEFNVGRQSLAVIPLPACLDTDFSGYFSAMRAEGGGLGLLFVSTSDGSTQLWKLKTDCDGVDSWVLGRTIELHKLLSPELQNECDLRILGIAEENNVVFLWSFAGVFMVQLDSLEFKKLPKINWPNWQPFECVYAAGV